MNEKELNALAEGLMMNRKMTNEVIWANVFHDTIKNSAWFQEQPLSPGRAAIGYPALYALYRVLDEFRPRRILEMGLGQSTKMIGSYIKWQEKQGNTCKHYVVEHDADWIRFFSNSFELSVNTEIVQLNLNKFNFVEDDGSETVINLYSDFKQKFSGEQFDLIFIDGPFGSPLYSRMDIVDILPECLNEEFILMLDDAERKGEQNTITMIAAMLQDNDIEYALNYYSGVKSTAIITSRDLRFYCSM